MKAPAFRTVLAALAALVASTPVWAETSVSASTAPMILTLPESIGLGLKGATDILKAKNTLDFTGTQLLQTYMQFLPDLQASGSYLWQSGRNYVTLTTPTTIETTNRGLRYSLTSTLNLFNGFSDAASWQSGRGRHTAASMTLYRAQQQIILDITSAYLQVLLDRDILAFADSNLKSSRSRSDLLTAQSEVGLKSLSDLYRQQAQTSADELFFLQEQNRARDDLILLLRRLRVDLRKNYDVTEVALDTTTVPGDPYAAIEEQHLLQSALDQRADLRAFKESAQAARSDVTAARSSYFPRLDLFAEMAGAGELLDRQRVNAFDVLPIPQRPLGVQLGDQTVYSAGLNMNWGIFSRYLTRSAVSRADTLAKNAQIDYEDLKLQVEGEVKQALGDYHATLQQLESANRGLQAAQQSYEAVSERYKVGASSIVDLLTAQSALVQAQSSEAQARVSFVLEKITMDNVLGRTVIPK